MGQEKNDKEIQAMIENTQKEVVAHAEKNRVRANNTKRKCVDGRYLPEEATGALSLAGGDLGLAMILLKLENPRTGQIYTAEEAYRTVKSFLKEQGKPFCWHTDQHADPVDHGHEVPEQLHVGCGHCNEAINSSDAYGIDSAKVQTLLDLIRADQESGDQEMECINLGGDHAEEAILIVTGDNYTVLPFDPETGKQYFIYDKSRRDQLLAELAKYAQLEAEAVTAEGDFQTMITLGQLKSSRGKPIFFVDVEEEKPKVSFFQFAPLGKAA